MEIAQNWNVLGAIGWLCTKTRPDLSAGISMPQKVQNAPLVADPIETNRIVSDARRHADIFSYLRA